MAAVVPAKEATPINEELPGAVRHYKKRTAKTEKKSRTEIARKAAAARWGKTGAGAGKARKYKCGQCGESGHTAKRCPSGKGATESGKRCFACQSEDHNTVNCPDLEAVVAKLQKAGKDSLRIASELHITLALVNKFWSYGGAATKEEDEEDAI